MDKGASLFFALVILNVLTAALLILINTSVSQIKIAGISVDSMIAFYAADAGAERALYEIKNNQPPPSGCPPYHYEGNLENNANYKICIPDGATAHSIGTYKSVQRKIELKTD